MEKGLKLSNKQFIVIGLLVIVSTIFYISIFDSRLDSLSNYGLTSVFDKLLRSPEDINQTNETLQESIINNSNMTINNVNNQNPLIPSLIDTTSENSQVISADFGLNSFYFGSSNCVPLTCEGLGKNCGTMEDGCGNTISCGTCASGTCGLNTANVCAINACIPKTCANVGNDCGTMEDGCGNTISCGTCASGTCGGNGISNVCGCTSPNCGNTNAVLPGNLEFYPTQISMGVRINYTNDNNNNAYSHIEYRKEGSSNWIRGVDMIRSDATNNKRFIGSIFWLDSDTTYEIKVIINDTDGGSISTGFARTKTNINTQITGNIYYVHVNGSDANPGTINQPFRTIQHSINLANPGDGIIVNPGIYYENLLITTSGTPSNPIHLIANQSGAILDGSNVNYLNRNDWISYGNNVYYIAYTNPVGIVVADYDQRLHNHASLADLINGAYGINQGYFVTGGNLYVRLEDGSSPNTHTMHIGNYNRGIELNGASYWHIEGLEIRNYGTTTGGAGIYMTVSSNNLIARNMIYNLCGNGLFINRATSKYNVLEQNYIWDSRVYLWDWNAVKDTLEEKDGIALRSGIGNIARFNKVLGIFNGIAASGGFLTEDEAAETDLHDNLVLSIGDDAFETDYNGINLRVFKNTIDYAYAGMSIAPNYYEPQYVIYNTFSNYWRRGFKLSLDGTGQTIIAHNTLVSNFTGTNAVGPTGGYYNLHFRNNILTGTGSMTVGDDVGESQTGNDFDWDLLYVYGTDPLFRWKGINYADITALRSGTGFEINGKEGNPLFVNQNLLNFNLQQNSPAIDSGSIIPGINNNYYGTAPDIGAYEYSAPVGNVISSCQTINSPGIYYLDRSLSTAGTCITVNSNNVKIDAQYYTITATTSVSIGNYNNVTITKLISNSGFNTGTLSSNITLSNSVINSSLNNALYLKGVDDLYILNNNLYGMIFIGHDDVCGSNRNPPLRTRFINNTVVASAQGGGSGSGSSGKMVEFVGVEQCPSSTQYIPTFHIIENNTIINTYAGSLPEDEPTTFRLRGSPNNTIRGNTFITLYVKGIGVYLRDGTDDNLIENNIIKMNGTIPTTHDWGGLVFSSGWAGTGLNRPSRNLIRNNTIISVGSQRAAYLQAMESGNRLENNLFVGGGDFIIWLESGNGGDLLYHNTIVSKASTGPLIYFSNGANKQNISRNIFARNSGTDTYLCDNFLPTQNYIGDNNLFNISSIATGLCGNTLTGFRSLTGYDLNSITGQVLFVNPSADNYRLQSGSPACNLNGDYVGAYQCSGVIDTTPPVISNIQSSGVTSNSAIITWTTDETSSSLVRYGTISGNYVYSDTGSNGATLHSITLTGLTSGTTYYYVVNSSDSSGNNAQSSQGTFTTNNATISSVVFVNPTPLHNSVLTNSNISINLSISSVNPINKVVLKINNLNYSLPNVLSCNFNNNLVCDNNVQPISSSGTTFAQGMFNGGILINGTDTLYYNSSNLNLNAGTISFWINPQTDWYNDPSGHSILDNYDDVSGTGLFLWKVSSSNNIRFLLYSNSGTYSVSYSASQFSAGVWRNVVFTYGDGLLRFYMDGFLVNQTTYSGNIVAFNPNTYVGIRRTLNYQVNSVIDQFNIYNIDLSPQEINNIYNKELGSYYINFKNLGTGVYFYNATVYESLDNIQSETRRFTISNSIDITPPQINGILVYNITTDSAIINWTTDENSSSLIRYKKSSDSQLIDIYGIDNVDEHSVILNGLLQNTSYDFYVNSTDIVGNSAQSIIQNFVTQSLPDITAPNYDYDYNPQTPTYYKRNKTYYFNISWNDISGIDKVWVEHNFYGNYINQTINQYQDNNYSFFITDLGAKPVYLFRWYANDTNGNLNKTSYYIFSIEKANQYCAIFVNTSRFTGGVQVGGYLPSLMNITSFCSDEYMLIVNGTNIYNIDDHFSVYKSYVSTGVYENANHENSMLVGLSAPGYYYKINVTDTFNYTYNETLSTVIIGANRNNSVNLYLNGNPSNLTIVVNNPINVSVNDSAGSPELYRDGTDVTFDELGINILLPIGIYEYIALSNTENSVYLNQNYTANRTGMKFYLNVTDASYNDPYAPTYSNLIIPSPSTYQKNRTYNFRIDWQDTSGIDSVWIEHNFNGQLRNQTFTLFLGNQYSFSVNDLGVNNYSFRWYANDTYGRINRTEINTFNLSKSQANCTININLNNNISFKDILNISGVCSNTDLGASLFKNGLPINSDNNRNISLSAGLYNITVNASSSFNYSYAINSTIIVINKSTNYVRMILNQQELLLTTNNVTIPESNLFNIGAMSQSGTFKLYRNNIDITLFNNTYQNLTVANYTYFVNSTGNENYTANLTGSYLGVNVVPSICSVNCQFLLSIKNGINLISLPLIISDSSISSIFNGHLLKIKGIYYYEPINTTWFIYRNDPTIPSTTLTNLDVGRGYFILANESFNININGDIGYPDGTLPVRSLSPGWNLIGINNLTSSIANQELRNFNVSEIWRYNSTNNYEQISINSNLDPGFGYWVYIT